MRQILCTSVLFLNLIICNTKKLELESVRQEPLIWGGGGGGARDSAEGKKMESEREKEVRERESRRTGAERGTKCNEL